MEVMSEVSSLFLWMLLFYVYQDRYKREYFSLKSVKTLLVFYTVKTLQLVIILVTILFAISRDFPRRSQAEILSKQVEESEATSQWWSDS
jgi:hypothetical protein